MCEAAEGWLLGAVCRTERCRGGMCFGGERVRVGMNSSTPLPPAARPALSPPSRPPSMAAFAAVATPQGRDAHNPFPLLRMVGNFMSYDQLMPPVRLRYSQLLGRPLMEPRAPLDHFLGSVQGGIYIEEVLHINAWVVGHTQLARGLGADWHVESGRPPGDPGSLPPGHQGALLAGGAAGYDLRR